MKTMKDKVLSKSVSEAFKPFFSKLKKSDDEPPFHYSFKKFCAFKIQTCGSSKTEKKQIHVKVICTIGFLHVIPIDMLFEVVNCKFERYNRNHIGFSHKYTS